MSNTVHCDINERCECDLELLNLRKYKYLTLLASFNECHAVKENQFIKYQMINYKKILSYKRIRKSDKTISIYQKHLLFFTVKIRMKEKKERKVTVLLK